MLVSLVELQDVDVRLAPASVTLPRLSPEWCEDDDMLDGAKENPCVTLGPPTNGEPELSEEFPPELGPISPTPFASCSLLPNQFIRLRKYGVVGRTVSTDVCQVNLSGERPCHNL